MTTQAKTELVIVATTENPTQAQLLKNALKAAAIPAYINDANLLQANAFLSGAVGGVKVFVAEADLQAARDVLADLERGAFSLEQDDAPVEPVIYEKLQLPVFSPDAAIVCSLALTPAFCGVTYLINARQLGDPKAIRFAWTQLFVLLIISIVSVFSSFQRHPSIMAPFRASVGLIFITLLCYFFTAGKQSQVLIERFGANYPRRPIMLPALVVGAGIAFAAYGALELL